MDYNEITIIGNLFEDSSTSLHTLELLRALTPSEDIEHTYQIQTTLIYRGKPYI